MDCGHVLSPQNNTDDNVTRHLPSYEEANIQYSLRLPAYRSSYIRRFHPYARYITRTTGEPYMVRLILFPLDTYFSHQNEG